MKRAAHKDTDSETSIPALPNSFPYNELLLRGRLSAKTRMWRWNHTGLTLLYTSTSTAHSVVSAYGLEAEAKTTPRMVLVGVGELVSVRETTDDEAEQITKEFNNGGIGNVLAGLYFYKFNNLKRFRNPIPFKPPRGAVRTFRVPKSVVAKALKEIGVSI